VIKEASVFFVSLVYFMVHTTKSQRQRSRLFRWWNPLWKQDHYGREKRTLSRKKLGNYLRSCFSEWKLFLDTPTSLRSPFNMYCIRHISIYYLCPEIWYTFAVVDFWENGTFMQCTRASFSRTTTRANVYCTFGQR
jgi:hypothetical protein